jgi:hypothetical protein
MFFIKTDMEMMRLERMEEGVHTGEEIPKG